MPGKTTTMPSITLVFVSSGAVMTRSYRYLDGDKLAVLAAVIESVISPVAALVIVAVKLFAVVE